METLPETVTTGDLAALLGVTPRQCRNVMDAAGVNPAGRGMWPLGTAIRAVLADARRNREGEAIAQARSRQLNARARREEIAAATALRELVSREDAEASLDAVLGVVNEELNGLPARVTRDVRMRRQIEAEINASRARMTIALEKAAAELEGSNTNDDDE